MKVDANGVCATREETPGEINLFCGMLPKKNADAVKLTRVNVQVEWEKDDFHINEGFICARSGTNLYCGLLPTGLGQPSQMTLVSSSVLNRNDQFAMASSQRDRTKVCAYNPSQLMCTTLQAKGDKLQIPTTLNQVGTDGPDTVDNRKLYMEGDYAWIAHDGAMSAVDDNSRQGELYRAYIGVQGNILTLKPVTSTASLYWSRVFLSPRGHAYAMQKSEDDNTQYTLWEIPAGGLVRQVEKPENRPNDAWHYDPNNPVIAVNNSWACALRRNGPTNDANSLWCWPLGGVTWVSTPNIPNSLP